MMLKLVIAILIIKIGISSLRGITLLINVIYSKNFVKSTFTLISSVGKLSNSNKIGDKKKFRIASTINLHHPLHLKNHQQFLESCDIKKVKIYTK